MIQFVIAAGVSLGLLGIAFIVHRLRPPHPASRAPNQLTKSAIWSMVTVFCVSNAQTWFEAHPLALGSPFPLHLPWPLTIAAYVIGSELLFYFNHRLLHTPWLFRQVHGFHHQIIYPTAFDFGSVHPVESLLLFSCLHVVPIFISVSRNLVRVYGTIMALMPILEHGRGLDVFPLNKIYDPDFHNRHHLVFHRNFGVGVLGSVFDRLLKTHANADNVKGKLTQPMTL